MAGTEIRRRTRVVVSRTEKRIPAIAAARGVFSRARVRGPGGCMLCSIKHTSKPRWPLPSLGGMRRALKSGPAQSDFILHSCARRALLERGLFTHLQGPLGVQEPVKLDGFGHEPGPAGHGHLLREYFYSVALFISRRANRKYAQTVMKFMITAIKFHKITGRDAIKRP